MRSLPSKGAYLHGETAELRPPRHPFKSAPPDSAIEQVALDPEAANAIAQAAASLTAERDSALATELAAARAENAANAAALAEIKALLSTPVRTPIEDDGIKAKPLERTPISGGDDRYSSVGSDDAEVATNLYLVKTVLEINRNYRPSDRLREVMFNAADRAIRQSYQGQPAYIDGPAGRKAVDPDRFITGSVARWKAEARAKAMTSTSANAGDEWVPTFASSELWQDFHLATTVAAAFPRVDMPTNPYTLPTLDADVTFKHASSENTAVTASNLNTGNATLTASKIMGEVDFSGELTEDSIIPVVPAIRANLVRRGAQTIDDLLVHGDTETGATGNVNLDDAAPTAGDFFLALNGLRKFAVVTNTAQTSNVAAALTSANFNAIRLLLLKYGSRADDLLIITGVETYLSMLDIAEVITPDKYGAGATILRGELARFFNIPILLSETIPLLTTAKAEADGKASTTASNNTLGWLLLVNRTQWRLGFRRELNIESFRDIQKDQNILVASFRQAQIPSGIATTHTASGRNITITS